MRNFKLVNKLVGMFSLLLVASGVNAATLTLVPTGMETVNVGESVTYNIEADFGTALTSGGSLDLSFAPTGIVDVSAASVDATLFEAVNTADVTVGNVFMEGLTFTDETGTFIFGTITFIAQAVGLVDLTLTPSVWGDCCGTEIPVTNISTAQINVVPIPPAIWLLGSGIVGLIGMARRKRTTVVA